MINRKAAIVHRYFRKTGFAPAYIIVNHSGKRSAFYTLYTIISLKFVPDTRGADISCNYDKNAMLPAQG